VQSGTATDAQFHIPHTWQITHTEDERVSGEVSVRE
jgi:hypothetical protein